MRNVMGLAVVAGAFAVAVPTYAANNGKGASAQSATGAANSADAPGQTGTAPGLSGTTPGQTGVTPGQRGAMPPGLGGTSPGQSGTAPGQSDEPKPVPGESVVVETPAGTVHVRTADGKEIALGSATEIPVGAVIDTTEGAITLSAARPDGRTYTGTFNGGVFKLLQDARSGYTDLYLRGGSFRSCRATTQRYALASSSRVLASASASRPVRTLWGSDNGGRFRTHGRNSVATVRGTKWLTEDGCRGTLTRVTEGAVDVKVKRTGRVVTVRAGHSYLARSH